MVIELDYSEEKQHQTLVQTMYIDDEKHCILYVQTLRNLLRYLKGELFNV